jgi:polyphenol oxidase
MAANQSAAGARAPRALRSKLLEERGFSHGFSLAPLDFRRLATADASLREIVEDVGVDRARLYQASQVHGARVVVAEGDPAELLREEADAVVGRDRGVAVGVRVADCTPVLAANVETGHVVAIHAGWRGVVAGVVRAGIDAIRSRGEIVAAIGPSIGVCCFEVGDDVAAQIAEACGEASVVVRGRGAKPYVDMRRAVRAQLEAAGVAGALLEDVAGCTKCGGERFHSHRRDADRAGRHLMLIQAFPPN